jgi:hypothetical protein
MRCVVLTVEHDRNIKNKKNKKNLMLDLIFQFSKKWPFLGYFWQYSYISAKTYPRKI